MSISLNFRVKATIYNNITIAIIISLMLLRLGLIVGSPNPFYYFILIIFA